MALLQRRNPLERLALRSQSPVLLQFFPMELIPFEHMSQSPSREMPFNNSGFQIYHNPMLSINGVEMSRLVLAVKHLDDDTQKPADLRHDAAPSFAGLDTGAAPFVTSNFQPLMNCHGQWGLWVGARGSKKIQGCNETLRQAQGDRKETGGMNPAPTSNRQDGRPRRAAPTGRDARDCFVATLLAMTEENVLVAMTCSPGYL